MKTNITLIGINFYPEDSAIGLYSTQMAEYLTHSHEINVITGFPYYPEWEIREEYKKKANFIVEQKNGMKIYRYKQYVPKNPTFKNRILHLLDFTFGSIRNVLKIKKCDLVICVVPFTSSIALGLLLAKLRGAKVWVHIQDFEFDAAVESGLAGESNGIKAKFFQGLFWLETKLLNKADIVSTISYGMIEKLHTKTVTESFYFPNWIDQNAIDPEKALKHPYLLSNKFKVLYSGNIGAKQDWGFFLRVIEYFQHNEEIEFIVVGAGAKKQWLVEQTKNIKNVKHYMPIEYAALPDLLCSTDLHILFQKNDVLDTVMPSKILGMMASAKPSLVTGNLQSESAKIFKTSKGGFFFDSNQFEAVVQTIDMLHNDHNKGMEVGRSARNYIITNFSYSKVLPMFEKKIRRILNTDQKILV